MSNSKLLAEIYLAAEGDIACGGHLVGLQAVWSAALEEAALAAECAAPNDGRDHAECPFCSVARDIRALKEPITQAAGESAVSAVHRGGSTGMESSREGERPSADEVQGYMMALK